MRSLAKIGGVVLDALINALFWVGAVVLGLTALGVTVAVIFRAAGRPLSAVSELSAYMLLIVTMFASPRLLRDGGHIAIDVLPIAERRKQLADRITSLLGAAVFAYVTWYAATLTTSLARTGSATESVLRIPTAYLTAVVLVGTLLLAVQFLRNAVGRRTERVGPAEVGHISAPSTEQAV